MSTKEANDEKHRQHNDIYHDITDIRDISFTTFTGDSLHSRRKLIAERGVVDMGGICIFLLSRCFSTHRWMLHDDAGAWFGRGGRYRTVRLGEDLLQDDEAQASSIC